MSARTVYAPANLLSESTRKSITELVCLDDYASNVERRLRNLGEDRLADRMPREIEQSIDQDAAC